MNEPPAILDEFQTFWDAYPRHRNTSKMTARKSWVRARLSASAEEIMAGLARYEFNPEPRYQPHAATWLNQRRWELNTEDLSIDPWGLQEHIAGKPSSEGLGIDCYSPEVFYPLMLAAALPETWRGSLRALDGWVQDGYAMASVYETIVAIVAQDGAVQGLDALDRKVRRLATRNC